METGNRLTVASGKRAGGEGWKEEEGISQRTCIRDPWTWTTGWGQIVGAGSGLDGGGQRGKNWDNCNRINKILKINKKGRSLEISGPRCFWAVV